MRLTKFIRRKLHILEMLQAHHFSPIPPGKLEPLHSGPEGISHVNHSLERVVPELSSSSGPWSGESPQWASERSSLYPVMRQLSRVIPLWIQTLGQAEKKGLGMKERVNDRDVRDRESRHRVCGSGVSHRHPGQLFAMCRPFWEEPFPSCGPHRCKDFLCLSFLLNLPQGYTLFFFFFFFLRFIYLFGCTGS